MAPVPAAADATVLTTPWAGKPARVQWVALQRLAMQLGPGALQHEGWWRWQGQGVLRLLAAKQTARCHVQAEPRQGQNLKLQVMMCLHNVALFYINSLKQY